MFPLDMVGVFPDKEKFPLVPVKVFGFQANWDRVVPKAVSIAYSNGIPPAWSSGFENYLHGPLLFYNDLEVELVATKV